MKLWGRLSSINVRKVVLTARLLELDLDRVDAGAAYGVQTPELAMLDTHLARQPFMAGEALTMASSTCP